MDKGLTLRKWGQIVRPKIPQIPQNLLKMYSADLPNLPKRLGYCLEKRLHWAFVVCDLVHCVKITLGPHDFF